MKRKIGLTSVTFRHLPIEEILQICRKAGIDGIEWGGDIHVPSGDLALADRVREQTQEAGLSVTAYGSYYRLCDRQDFVPVLDTASALGAPLIRIWAGTIPSAEASESYLRDAAKELAEICRMADARDIAVGLEYHRGTLTDNCETTLRLLDMAAQGNLSTYWQMNPDISVEERLREIALLRDRICCVHTFFWGEGNVRFPLAEGAGEFEQYLALLKRNPCPVVFEFVKDDSVEQLLEDAGTLKGLLEAADS
ncbi:MAG: sugar phosphate isomerase/epimerase family protein [Oscillospiraceae bacterium]